MYYLILNKSTERKKMKLKSIALLVTGAMSIGNVHSKNHDLATNNVLPSNQINERYFVTNSSNTTANITINDDFIVNSEGSFHLGFAGKIDQQAGSVAAGDINMIVNGNMQVYNDTWIGKFDTRFFTQYLGLHKDFPYSPIEKNIDLHVTGDINVELGADKERGGLMILAGNVMGTGINTNGQTTVRVDGNTNIRSGDNHLAGTASAPARLITKSFNLTGGDIEIIGVNTVLETTNTNNDQSSVLVGNTGKMIVMRGGTVDVSRGGDFNVVDEGILTASRGNGFVKLSSNGQLNIAEHARIESSKGSLSISDQTAQTSKLNIAGIIHFGVADNRQINKISGDNVDVKSSAKFSATNDFIKEALNFSSGQANIVVLAGNQSLKIADMKEGETRSLIKNIYGDFNFKLVGNELSFVNASNITNLNDDQQSEAAAKRQLNRYYRQVGMNSKNIAKGFTANLVKIADKSLNNVRNAANVVSDRTIAGDLNWEVFKAIANGNTTIESGKMVTHFTQSLAGLYNNNRGLHLTEIALNSFNYTKLIIDNRLQEFNNYTSYDNDNIWINLTHQYENTNSVNGISGYKFSANGFMLGFDKAIMDNWVLGSAVGYSDGNYKDKSAVSNDSDLKNYQIQFYTRYNLPNAIFTKAYLGYVYGQNRLKQDDGSYLAKEKFHSKTWHMGTAVGYDWQISQPLIFTPTLGLAYVYTENSRHNVKYNQIDLIKYGKATNSAVIIPVDLSAKYTLLQNNDDQLTIKAKAGYTFNLSDDEFDGDITVNGINGLTKMKTHTSDRTKNQFNLGTGMTFKHKSFAIDVDYHYFGESQRDAHYLTFTTKYHF